MIRATSGLTRFVFVSWCVMAAYLLLCFVALLVMRHDNRRASPTPSVRRRPDAARTDIGAAGGDLDPLWREFMESERQQ